MASSERTGVAPRPGVPRARPASRADDPLPAAGTAVAVFGCEPDEAAAFRELAPALGVRLTLVDAPVSEATADLAAGHRCLSVGHKTPVTDATLRRLAALGVRYVSTRSAGLDHLDVEAARGLGIRVEGVAYSPGAVADHTLMLMLMALRNARSVLARAEAHDFRLQDVRGRELHDMTVGVVGTGRIGAAVVERLGGFGCRVLACDHGAGTSAGYVDLDQLLARSDLVTLHTPLVPETYHLLDRGRIGRMRRGAVVVNTGRGALVDTVALLAALEDGRLGGAALDVLEGEAGVFYADRREDPVDDELFLRLHRLPNVLVTPHTAYYTDRALRDTVRNTLLGCLDFEGCRHD